MPHRNIYRRILFCTDLSEHASIAFLYAVNTAAANETCELIIFHVVPEPQAQFWKSYIYEVDEIDTKAKSDIDKKIEREYIGRIPKGVRWSVKAAVGNVEQKIIEAAETLEADLIVVGREGSRRATTWFFGNTVGRIVRKASCPVLVVPSTRTAQNKRPPQ